MHSDSEMVKLRDVVETLIYMTDEDSDGVEEVMQLTTIDIIQCEECIHHDDGLCHRPKWSFAVEPTDFCSYGERRTGTLDERIKRGLKEWKEKR